MGGTLTATATVGTTRSVPLSSEGILGAGVTVVTAVTAAFSGGGGLSCEYTTTEANTARTNYPVPVRTSGAYVTLLGGGGAGAQGGAGGYPYSGSGGGGGAQVGRTFVPVSAMGPVYSVLVGAGAAAASGAGSASQFTSGAATLTAGGGGGGGMPTPAGAGGVATAAGVSGAVLNNGGAGGTGLNAVSAVGNPGTNVATGAGAGGGGGGCGGNAGGKGGNSATVTGAAGGAASGAGASPPGAASGNGGAGAGGGGGAGSASAAMGGGGTGGAYGGGGGGGGAYSTTGNSNSSTGGNGGAGSTFVEWQPLVPGQCNLYGVGTLAGVIAPLFDASNGGSNTGVNAASGAVVHTLGASANYLFMAVHVTGVTLTGVTANWSYNFTNYPMTRLAVVGDGGSTTSGTVVFGLANPPKAASGSSSGNVSGSFGGTASTWSIVSASYYGVLNIGAPITNNGTGTALASGPVAGQVPGTTWQVFGQVSGAAAQSYSQQSRSYTIAQTMGDAPNGAGVIFTATIASAAWSSVAIPFNFPYVSSAAPFSGNGSLSATVDTNPGMAYFAGSGTFTPPPWANHLDIVACGAGGGGEVCGFSGWGQGGYAGQWNGVTLNIGTDIAAGVALNVTVGGGGQGGPGGSAQADGSSGGNSSVSGTGWAGMTAGGGQGGMLTNNQTTGASPGNYAFNGATYPGGTGGTASASGATNGTAPGGGGAGSMNIPQSGGAGGNGAVWIRYYE
jgi:hypothetical protein